MREVKRSALVNRPPAELFALINDIESYPQFLPWCTHARVESRTPQEIVATLGYATNIINAVQSIAKFLSTFQPKPPSRVSPTRSGRFANHTGIATNASRVVQMNHFTPLSP